MFLRALCDVRETMPCCSIRLPVPVHKRHWGRVTHGVNGRERGRRPDSCSARRAGSGYDGSCLLEAYEVGWVNAPERSPSGSSGRKD